MFDFEWNDPAQRKPERSRNILMVLKPQYDTSFSALVSGYADDQNEYRPHHGEDVLTDKVIAWAYYENSQLKHAVKECTGADIP